MTSAASGNQLGELAAAADAATVAAGVTDVAGAGEMPKATGTCSVLPLETGAAEVGPELDAIGADVCAIKSWYWLTLKATIAVSSFTQTHAALHWLALFFMIDCI